MYNGGKSSGKNIVKNAYHDMLRMTELINPFLVTVNTDGSPIEPNAGVLETRFFGDLPMGSAKRELIHHVFQTAALWYPWYPFDWFTGARINVYCEEDHPNDSGASCNTVVEGVNPTAYASNKNGVSQIIFCDKFFSLDSLDERKKFLDGSSLQMRKNPRFMATRASTLFHEMTHLSIVNGQYPNMLHDQFGNPLTNLGGRMYGAVNAEWFAKKFPGYVHLNADNYAFYASAVWFQQFYGLPDPATPPPKPGTASNPDTMDDFWDEFTDDGSKPNVAEFDNPDYDEISIAEGIAFAAGDYTPNGWLKNKKLRILALGDSITYGFQSSDGNGYREDLVNILSKANNAVKMIGSVRSGNMPDNYNEGHSGATIAEIATYKNTYRQRPNVILLHAGSNDLKNPTDPSTAPQRLDSLVGQLLAACPDATILVARIIPSTNAGAAALIPQYNQAITELMAARVNKGQHVMVVDMPSAVKTSDLYDGLHPNDGGYNKMAIKWAIGLTAVNAIGWIKDPVAGSGSTNLVTCSHDPNWISQGQIANGAGLGNNIYLTVQCAFNKVSGLCECEHGHDFPLTAALVKSNQACERIEVISPTTTAVHFADLNGDGRAEYLFVDKVGAVTAFLNLGGPDQGANAAKVSWLAQGVIASGIGSNRSNVIFADLNGDGRAEYLWVHDDGSVDAWLNLGGPDDGPNAGKVQWLAQGTICAGIGKDGAGVRFADPNGDGRAEYLYVNRDGSVIAYLNLGGPDNGPNAAKVSWLAQGVIATGLGVKGTSRDNVVFADINGDGREDYLTVSRVDGSVQAWLNGGGPDNGPNAAKVVWHPHGTIGTGVGNDGTGIQFADLNGDGRAEFIDVAYDTSALTAWLNGC